MPVRSQLCVCVSPPRHVLDFVCFVPLCKTSIPLPHSHTKFLSPSVSRNILRVTSRPVTLTLSPWWNPPQFRRATTWYHVKIQPLLAAHFCPLECALSVSVTTRSREWGNERMTCEVSPRHHPLTKRGGRLCSVLTVWGVVLGAHGVLSAWKDGLSLPFHLGVTFVFLWRQRADNKDWGQGGGRGGETRGRRVISRPHGRRQREAKYGPGLEGECLGLFLDVHRGGRFS